MQNYGEHGAGFFTDEFLEVLKTITDVSKAKQLIINHVTSFRGMAREENIQRVIAGVNKARRLDDVLFLPYEFRLSYQGHKVIRSRARA